MANHCLSPVVTCFGILSKSASDWLQNANPAYILLLLARLSVNLKNYFKTIVACASRIMISHKGEAGCRNYLAKYGRGWHSKSYLNKNLFNTQLNTESSPPKNKATAKLVIITAKEYLTVCSRVGQLTFASSTFTSLRNSTKRFINRAVSFKL